MTVEASPTSTPTATEESPRRGKSRWYAAALAIVAISTAVFVVTNHRIVADGVRALGSFGPRTVVAAVVLVLTGIAARGVQACVAYRMLGMPARLRTMIRLSAASHAVGKVTKSGGLAGLVPYCGDARRNGRHLGPVVGAYVCMQATSVVAMALLMATALVTASSTGALQGFAFGGTVVVVVLVSVGVAALVVIGSRRDWLEAIVGRVGRLVARIRRRPPPTLGDDVVEAVDRLRADRRSAVALVLAAVAGKLVGAAGLVLVMHGLHLHVGVLRTVLIYLLTQVAASFGPLPAGAGTTEAALGALLLMSGVPAATIAAAVIAFRLVDLWLPLLAGGLAGLRRPSLRAVSNPAIPRASATVARRRRPDLDADAVGLEGRVGM